VTFSASESADPYPMCRPSRPPCSGRPVPPRHEEADHFLVRACGLSRPPGTAERGRHCGGTLVGASITASLFRHWTSELPGYPIHNFLENFHYFLEMSHFFLDLSTNFFLTSEYFMSRPIPSIEIRTEDLSYPKSVPNSFYLLEIRGRILSLKRS
jgi:hypothetical protein